MNILLGAPVWYGNRPFTRTIEELYKLELDYFEFSLDYPLPNCMEEAERGEIKGLLDEFGLKIAFHSPLDISVAHPRDGIADASMTVLRRCMEFSAEFMPLSLYYNLHLHPKVSTYKLDDVRGEIKQKGLGRWLEITKMASEFGIPVSVENDLVPFEWSDLIFEALSLSLSASDVCLTFDIGHAIMAEVTQPKSGIKMKDGNYLDYLKRWIDKCGDKIRVVHLHDCSLTEKQDHLSIGSGELDFDAVFKVLKGINCKYMVIETFWRNKEKEEMTYEEMRKNVEFCRCYL
ncbi:MAG: sugar phosphate isomerase/epimerase [Methanophagales archaeon]|nr:sugar phosphate isomerase/epimerase [Methanophagales archaeon]